MRIVSLPLQYASPNQLLTVAARFGRAGGGAEIFFFKRAM